MSILLNIVILKIQVNLSISITKTLMLKVQTQTFSQNTQKPPYNCSFSHTTVLNFFLFSNLITYSLFHRFHKSHHILLLYKDLFSLSVFVSHSDIQNTAGAIPETPGPPEGCT